MSIRYTLRTLKDEDVNLNNLKKHELCLTDSGRVMIRLDNDLIVDLMGTTNNNLITQNYVEGVVQNYINNNVQNQINNKVTKNTNEYIKDVTVDNHTVTVKKGDNTTQVYNINASIADIPDVRINITQSPHQEIIIYPYSSALTPVAVNDDSSYVVPESGESPYYTVTTQSFTGKAAYCFQGEVHGYYIERGSQFATSAISDSGGFYAPGNVVISGDIADVRNSNYDAENPYSYYHFSFYAYPNSTVNISVEPATWIPYENAVN